MNTLTPPPSPVRVVALDIEPCPSSVLFCRATGVGSEPALHPGVGLEQGGLHQGGARRDLYVRVSTGQRWAPATSTCVLIWCVCVCPRCAPVRQLLQLHGPPDAAAAPAQPEAPGEPQRHLPLPAERGPGADPERCPEAYICTAYPHPHTPQGLESGWYSTPVNIV